MHKVHEHRAHKHTLIYIFSSFGTMCDSRSLCIFCRVHNYYFIFNSNTQKHSIYICDHCGNSSLLFQSIVSNKLMHNGFLFCFFFFNRIFLTQEWYFWSLSSPSYDRYNSYRNQKLNININHSLYTSTGFIQSLYDDF